jgi:hypothetical protein
VQENFINESNTFLTLTRDHKNDYASAPKTSSNAVTSKNVIKISTRPILDASLNKSVTFGSRENSMEILEREK